MFLNATLETLVAEIGVEAVFHPHGFNLYTAGIQQLSQLLSLGTLTSLQILSAYLEQIAKHNSRLCALVHVAPREYLIQLAKQRDAERAAGKVRGSLHDIPIVVKDNIATDEELGMPTTAGSYALLGRPVKKDAFIVHRLRQAGAIIIGKGNMSELASYKCLDADGWSAVGGQTINVFAANASPGSSSAGNGVAVAAGMCPASVATETDGSIVLPAMQSGLYGLKPTVGLLSRAGIVPFATHFDTPGPMAKNVYDLAVLLDVMQGDDSDDPTTTTVERLPNNVKIAPPTQASEATESESRARQNWHDVAPWKRADKSALPPNISEAFESALIKMASVGATITDPADIPSAVDGSLWECVDGSRSLVVNADCKEYLGRYLLGLGGTGGCQSVDDVIAFNEKHADIEMPPEHPNQDVLKRTCQAAKIDSPEYLTAKREMKLVAGTHGLDAVFDKHDLDALFSIGEGHHSPANMVGYPMGVIPLGISEDGVPFGAIFIGRKNGERTLLAIMSAWEAECGGRPLPPMATEGSGGVGTVS